MVLVRRRLCRSLMAGGVLNDQTPDEAPFPYNYCYRLSEYRRADRSYVSCLPCIMIKNISAKGDSVTDAVYRFSFMTTLGQTLSRSGIIEDSLSITQSIYDSPSRVGSTFKAGVV